MDFEIEESFRLRIDKVKNKDMQLCIELTDLERFNQLYKTKPILSFYQKTIISFFESIFLR